MWPDGEPTQELLGRVRDGDDAAVNGLLERHRAALRKMVHVRLDRRLAGRIDASDVVQDVLWEAARRLDDYLGEARIPFHLWLRQLAKDRIIDMHRRHRAAQRRSVDREQRLAVEFAERSSLDLANQLRDAELTPAAAAIRRELQQRFLLVLDDLADDDREIILMRHAEHLGNGEAAQALGISPPAAGMRYLRALRKLRSLLAEPGSQPIEGTP